MFIQHPDIMPINERDFILLSKCVYKWKDITITVPKDFVTDLASIPRLVWTLTGWTPDGLHRDAAIVHDFLYQWRGRPMPAYIDKDKDSTRPWPVQLDRKECDQIFYDAMIDLDVSPGKAGVMKWAVNVFGRFAW